MARSRQPRLVVDADQRPSHGTAPRGLGWAHGMVTSRPVTVAPCRASAATVPTSNRRSSILMRSCRVSTVSPGSTGTARLREHRSGVHAVVDEVQGGSGDLDAVGERVGDRAHAGERGQQRRMSVDHRAADAGQEARPEDLHEPRTDHEIGVVLGDRLRRGRRPRRRRSAWSATRTVNVGTPERSARASPSMPAAVGSDGHDLRRVAGLGRGVEQRLQQRAGAGDQDDHPRRHGELHPVGTARRRGQARTPPRVGGRRLTATSVGRDAGHPVPGARPPGIARDGPVHRSRRPGSGGRSRAAMLSPRRGDRRRSTRPRS